MISRKELEQTSLKMSSVKLDLFSRKIIKPSSSTPRYLQTFKLSLWGEPMLPIYGTLIFFYQSNNACQNDEETLSMFSQRSNSLQKSLFQALMHYYPLAGRLKDASTVECNDEGAYFVEARIDCQLSTLLNHPDAEFLSHFCPALDSDNLPSGCMLAIQLTLFNCVKIFKIFKGFIVFSRANWEAASCCNQPHNRLDPYCYFTTLYMS